MNFWLIVIGLIALLVIFTVLLTAHLSQPRSKPIARAGGNLTPTAATGEVAARHPPKDQGRVPQ